MRAASIYGLTDPTTGECRYVGKTTGTPQRRLQAHINEARRNRSLKPRHLTHWIRELLSEGFLPEVFEVETVEDWREAEAFWIEYFRSIGCRLTNILPGGVGIDMCPETAAKISHTRKELGLSFTRKQVERAQATLEECWKDPGWRAARIARTSATQLQLWATPEHREHMLARQRERYARMRSNPEELARHKESRARSGRLRKFRRLRAKLAPLHANP